VAVLPQDNRRDTVRRNAADGATIPECDGVDAQFGVGAVFGNRDRWCSGGPAEEATATVHCGYLKRDGPSIVSWLPAYADGPPAGADAPAAVRHAARVPCRWPETQFSDRAG